MHTFRCNKIRPKNETQISRQMFWFECVSEWECAIFWSCSEWDRKHFYVRNFFLFTTERYACIIVVGNVYIWFYAELKCKHIDIINCDAVFLCVWQFWLSPKSKLTVSYYSVYAFFFGNTAGSRWGQKKHKFVANACKGFSMYILKQRKTANIIEM